MKSWQNTVLTIGILGYMYLICFGFIAIFKLLKSRFPKIGILGVIICLLGMFTFPLVEMARRLIYIVDKQRQRRAES